MAIAAMRLRRRERPYGFVVFEPDGALLRAAAAAMVVAVSVAAVDTKACKCCCCADGCTVAPACVFSNAESGTPSKDAFCSAALGSKRRRDELSADIFFIL